MNVCAVEKSAYKNNITSKQKVCFEKIAVLCMCIKHSKKIIRVYTKIINCYSSSMNVEGGGVDPQSKPRQDMSGRPRRPGSIPTQLKSRLRKQFSKNLAQYLCLFAFILVIVGFYFLN